MSRGLIGGSGTVIGRVAVLVAAVAMGRDAAGDEFDRIEGDALVGVVRAEDAKPRPSLTIREIEALPGVLRETRSALLVARTDRGNIARMLVSPGFRRSAKDDGELIPVLVLERFDTFDAGDISTRLARGKDLVLFDGFAFDLDTGQVVPEGQGGDLRFSARGEGSPALQALDRSKLYTPSKPPARDVSDGARPTIGRLVVPGDFAGRFRLYANGQWSGWLDLKVDPDGAVSGRFRSDLNGTAYPVTGQVSPSIPQKVAFTVNYPRTRQDFEGLLWTEGKGAMAGAMTMLDHAYGFFAIREGGVIGPEGEDVGPLSGVASKPGRKAVSARKGQYALDGVPRTDQELAEDLKKAVAADPATWVLLRIPADEPFSAVSQAFDLVGSSGVSSIRLAPLEGGP